MVSAGDWAPFLAAAAYVLLAAWILSIRPRRRLNLFLAAYVGFFGLTIVAEAWWRSVPEAGAADVMHPAQLTLRAVSAAANLSALGIASLASGRPWRSRAFACALGVGVLFWAWGQGTSLDRGFPFDGPERILTDAVYLVEYTAYVAALALLWDAARRGTSRAMAALLTVSLMLAYAFLDGAAFVDSARAAARGDAWLAANLLSFASQDLVVAVAWLWLGSTLPWRPALVTGLAVLALNAAGAVTYRTVGDITVAGAAVRFLAVLLVAYAILRHQLLGLDVKVRFAVKGSTIAAVFIAVFFVVSEASQQFFADTSGSTYLGIAATGGLVFAIAPLQRLADQVAAKAVPGPAPPQWVAATESPRRVRREEVYRNALRLALRDRRLSPDEEVQLAELADELGLSASTALRLRQEAALQSARA